MRLDMKMRESGGNIPVKFGESERLQGEQGATFTPSMSENGTLSWTNDRGLDNPSPVNLTGPPGENGKDGKDGAAGASGADGKDGYTPQRGVDYWTDADKAKIKAYVDEQFGDVDAALDGIIALQESLIGGDGA